MCRQQRRVMIPSEPIQRRDLWVQMECCTLELWHSVLVLFRRELHLGHRRWLSVSTTDPRQALLCLTISNCLANFLLFLSRLYWGGFWFLINMCRTWSVCTCWNEPYLYIFLTQQSANCMVCVCLCVHSGAEESRWDRLWSCYAVCSGQERQQNDAADAVQSLPQD